MWSAAEIDFLEFLTKKLLVAKILGPITKLPNLVD